MEIRIDTATENPDTLVALARFLIQESGRSFEVVRKRPAEPVETPPDRGCAGHGHTLPAQDPHD